jgi:hypothetical protein
MGGSLKKSFEAGGKFWKSVNKVVDPLNIMDPMGVLPTSMIAGKKPFQFDKNFGKLQWNLGGGGGSTSYSRPKSNIDTSGMFNAQNEILASMKAQSEAAAAKQQSSLNQLLSKDLSSSTVPATETSVISSPTTVANSEINSTTSGLPVEFVYKPSTSASQTISSNSFTLPDMSNIKFGGT